LYDPKLSERDWPVKVEYNVVMLPLIRSSATFSLMEKGLAGEQ